MSKLKPFLGVLGVVTLGYVAYLLFKRSRVAPDLMTDNGDTIIPSPGSGGGTTVSDIGCSSNCCNTPCANINLNVPSANYGCCGDRVLDFQTQLNGMLGAGANITPDGAYGTNTQAAHQQVLNTNNGVWPEFVGPTQPE